VLQQVRERERERERENDKELSDLTKWGEKEFEESKQTG
jgi:hypothetical protein